MTSQELFEVVKDFNNGEVKETIENVNELITNLKDNVDQYIMKLEIALEEFADDNNVCKFCGEEMIFIVDRNMPEYQCSPVGYKECPNHCED